MNEDTSLKEVLRKSNKLRTEMHRLRENLKTPNLCKSEVYAALMQVLPVVGFDLQTVMDYPIEQRVDKLVNEVLRLHRQVQTLKDQLTERKVR